MLFRSNLVRVNNKLGNYSKVVDACEIILKICIPIYGEGHPNIASVYFHLAIAYSMLEDYTNALNVMNKSYDIFKSHLPADATLLKSLREAIENLKLRISER